MRISVHSDVHAKTALFFPGFAVHFVARLKLPWATSVFQQVHSQLYSTASHVHTESFSPTLAALRHTSTGSLTAVLNSLTCTYRELQSCIGILAPCFNKLHLP